MIRVGGGLPEKLPEIRSDRLLPPPSVLQVEGAGTPVQAEVFEVASPFGASESMADAVAKFGKKHGNREVSARFDADPAPAWREALEAPGIHVDVAEPPSQSPTPKCCSWAATWRCSNRTT